jgi:hypothetical protein
MLKISMAFMMFVLKYINGTLRTVALRWPIFKQKKGSATISLGLNYCSMGSSLSPFRDTVPLIRNLASYNNKEQASLYSWRYHSTVEDYDLEKNVEDKFFCYNTVMYFSQ